MFSSSRIPLAWLNLTHDKRHFAVSVAGVTFAVLLMFMQVGFRNALLDATTSLIRQFDADLVLISKAKYSLVANAPFPRRRLYQAQEVAGIARATPFYMEYRFALWKNPRERQTPPRLIRVLAFDPAQPALLLPEVASQVERLQLPDTALMDVTSKRAYGLVRPGLDGELAGRTLHVVGTFRLGTDFASDGNLIMSDRTFATFFPSGDSAEDTLGHVEVGLLKVANHADPAAVKASLQAILPTDVLVFTRDEFIQREYRFWQQHTPVGFVFGLGAALGFIVGLVICYQVLATDVADHLAEFATLKAIGYPNGYLTGVILREALWLSVFGFLPGLAGSSLLYNGLERLTGLPMRLTGERVGLILILTVLMCVLSGMLALRKVQTADPAEVF